MSATEPPEPTIRRPLTVAEAADLLGVGRNAVYQLIRDDLLRAIRIGRLIRIPLEALEEFLTGGAKR